MSVVANVAINVDATKAISQLNAVGTAANGTSNAFTSLTNGLGGLGTAIAGLGLGALTQQLGAAGIDADRTAQRIKSLAGANGEAQQVFDAAGRAAKQFGLGTTEAEKGMADLYGRLRPSGVALKDIETTFFGVNKAALAMGLTGADTENVFLQLAQAMGSGKLQGDEMRSIMEQLPAVGQAVAKVMGVTVGEVKKLGSDGKITTDILIKAAAELNKMQPPPPDAFRQFNAAMSDLRRELGENLLPIITPLVNVLLGLVQAFGALPEPVQTILVAVAGLATAAVALGGAIAVLTPALTALGGLGATIAGWAGIVAPATAAITAALGGILTYVTGTLLPGLLAVFSGPVGWTVLAVAAVVAMVVLFQEPIAEFFTWLGQTVSSALPGVLATLHSIFVQPFIDIWDNILKGPITAFFDWIGGVIEWGLQAAYAIAYQIWVQPWINIWEGLLRDPVTGFIEWVQGVWDSVVGFFEDKVITPISNAWNALWNTVSGLVEDVVSTFQSIWNTVAEWFDNNVVTPILEIWDGMTSAIADAITAVAEFFPKVWDGIVNTGKSVINGFLRWIASSVNSVIGLVNKLINGFNKLPGPDIPLIPTVSVPQFAKGGVVDSPTLALIGEGGEREYVIPESKMAAASASYLSGSRGNSVIGGSATAESGSPSINITTGPVVEFNGDRYVTVADMERAVKATAAGVIGRLRSPSSRMALGLAR